LLVTPEEELMPDSHPEVLEFFIPELDGPFFSLVPETAWRFQGTVDAGQNESVADLRVVLADLVGNTTPGGVSACNEGTISFAVDGLVPVVKDIELTIDDEAQVDLSIPLATGRKVTAVVQVEGSQELPSVSLGGGMLTPLDESPEAMGGKIFSWTFSRLLDGSEQEGEQVIAVKGADLAGNSFLHEEIDQPLFLDFTRRLPTVR